MVSAGVTLQQVQSAARDAGFAFGVDIAPRASCTIGGMIAANAGGVHVLRHGMMAEQVIGLEAVLADGATIGRVPALRKDNAGYHLAALLAGSEGTLAVITRAHLRLVPAMPARAVALLGLADAATTLAVIDRIRPALPSLSALELLFAECVDLVRRHDGVGTRHSPGSPRSTCSSSAPRAAACSTSSPAAIESCADLVVDSAIAEDEAGRAPAVALPRGRSEAINAAGVPHKLDVAVPLAAVPSSSPTSGHAWRRSRRVPRSRSSATSATETSTSTCSDSTRARPPSTTPCSSSRSRRTERSPRSTASAAPRRRSSAWCAAPADIAAMRAVKHALDPGGILNPGVVLDA